MHTYVYMYMCVYIYIYICIGAVPSGRGAGEPAVALPSSSGSAVISYYLVEIKCL